MSKYSNQAKVESVLKRSLTEEEASNLDQVIESVSDTINGSLNRQWSDIPGDGEAPEPESSDRLFDGEGKKELFIDDCTAVEQIDILGGYGEVIESYTDPSSFILYPLNATAKNSIVLRDTYFPIGFARVRVKAFWGSGAVPSAVITATSRLVADFLTKDSFSPYAQEDIEGYSYRLKSGSDLTEYTNTVLNSISHYRKITF